MMTPDRYNQVSELFLAVCDLPASERARYLDLACCQDSTLRAEVDAMLSADSNESILDVRLTLAYAARLDWGSSEGDRAQFNSHPLPGTIGTFTVLEVLGVGGMGIVYLAEQDRPRRRVALKVIKTGFASERLRKRFEYETQILGRLQHPGIAQIFEAGTASLGFGEQPFFAMEYVSGKPLIEFSEAAGLDVRGRLRLIVGVCDAVQHAHHKGVIHRDLKPGNILVDEGGRPKVLDFGVARVTDSDVRATTLRTDIGQFIGTIPYMSPEQASGDSETVDARADVYSLGVVLYELLTGRTPHELAGKVIHEAARIIRDDEATRLSSMNREFRGDLDTIVHKAIEKNRERRYQSVSEFAEDLGRFLRDEPIMARPASVTYQLRKFARRRKGLVAGTAVGAFALSLGAVLAWRAADARRVHALREQIAERDASAYARFLRELLKFASSDKVDFNQLTFRQVIDRAAEEIIGSLGNQPRVESSIRQTLGYNYLTVREFQKAEPHLDRAKEILATLGPEHEQARAQISLHRAQLYLQTGLPDKAWPCIEEALTGFRKSVGERHIDTVSAMQLQARYYSRTNQWDKAEGAWRAAIRAATAIRNVRHALTLQCKAELAEVLRFTKRYEEAEALHREVFEVRRETLGDNHVQTLTAMNNLGITLLQWNRWAEAAELLQAALEGQQKQWGPDHRETLVCQGNVISALMALQRWPEVEALARDGMDRVQSLPAADSLTVSFAEKAAEAFYRTGRYEQCATLCDRILETEFAKGNDTQQSRTLELRAQCLTPLDRLDEAERDLMTAFDLARGTPNPSVDALRKIVSAWMSMYDRSGQSDPKP